MQNDNMVYIGTSFAGTSKCYHTSAKCASRRNNNNKGYIGGGYTTISEERAIANGKTFCQICANRDEQKAAKKAEAQARKEAPAKVEKKAPKTTPAKVDVWGQIGEDGPTRVVFIENEEQADKFFNTLRNEGGWLPLAFQVGPRKKMDYVHGAEIVTL